MMILKFVTEWYCFAVGVLALWRNAFLSSIIYFSLLFIYLKCVEMFYLGEMITKLWDRIMLVLVFIVKN